MQLSYTPGSAEALACASNNVCEHAADISTRVGDMEDADNAILLRPSWSNPGSSINM